MNHIKIFFENMIEMFISINKSRRLNDFLLKLYLLIDLSIH
jgi:hypothetical protein